MDYCVAGKGVASWIRSAAASVLTILALAGCGGGGGGGSSGNITPDGPGGASKVFLADSQNQVVISSTNANPTPVNPPPGVLTVSRTITGQGVSNDMPDMAYDSDNDRLYVVKGTSIAVIDRASTASGNAPARVSTTTIGGPIVSVSLDVGNNELYVSNGSNGIFVFGGINAASGSITPIRTFTMTRNNIAVVPKRIFVTNNVLYAELNITGGEAIAIFSNAHDLGTLSSPSPVAVTQELTFIGVTISGITGNGGTDKLFVANRASSVMVFDSASLANGPATPDRTISTPSILEKITLATGTDRLYGISSNSLYIINHASSVDGAMVPVTTVTNSNVGTLTGLAVARN